MTPEIISGVNSEYIRRKFGNIVWDSVKSITPSLSAEHFHLFVIYYSNYFAIHNCSQCTVNFINVY